MRWRISLLHGYNDYHKFCVNASFSGRYHRHAVVDNAELLGLAHALTCLATTLIQRPFVALLQVIGGFLSLTFSTEATHLSRRTRYALVVLRAWLSR